MRWQDDQEFCEWLCSVEYAEPGPKGPVLLGTTGVVLYMWEAWLASRADR